MPTDFRRDIQPFTSSLTSQKRATNCAFFGAGLISAVWATIIPYLKINSGVSDGALGGLILCMGLGALFAMPTVGPLSSRFGCRKVILAGFTLLLLSMLTLPLLSHFWLLMVMVVLAGAGLGTVDCAMNVQAILVEKQSDKTMMSGFHGFYSLGGIAGALLMTFLLSLTSVTLSVVFCVCLIGVCLFYYQRHLLPYGNEQNGPAFALPRGPVLAIGTICFCFFLAEGAVLDWSSLFLTEYRSLPINLGGLGFAAFSIAMTAGRFTGDNVVSKFGGFPVVMAGTLTSAMGLVILLALPYSVTSIIGYFLIGLGAANVVPVMFTAIANQTVMPQSTAVPAVSTLGFSGVLLGPASIGVVAEHSSLSTALLLLIPLLALVLLLSRFVPYQKSQFHD
ncbi:MFS transporter [Alteromonas confluentis]|uniref:Major facilitator superfamily (MFS) profile domain-containing protein n=1 Tax=Alteromonas confluentis TaxID=1656094 RepID=A0A1E7Z7L9_9ALTE|nr:MFS transporter [Alteromonas confluentis]OFC69394.1 hypothetical protein BFC18_18450 [Alteromonas confluentis]